MNEIFSTHFIGRKQKSGWVSDTKVTATTFDELFEEDHHQKTENLAQRRKTEENTDIKKAWARHVSLDVSYFNNNMLLGDSFLIFWVKYT